jgi:hypothetical protein
LGSSEKAKVPNFISVVAAEGNDGLRMYTLGFYDSPFPFVIRNGTCIACGLEICRIASYPVIIC